MKFAKFTSYGYLINKVSKTEHYFEEFYILSIHQTTTHHEKTALHHHRPYSIQFM